MWKPFYVIHSYVYRKRPNQQNQPKPTQPKWTQPIQTKPGETKTNQIRNWRFLVVFYRWLYPKSLLQCVAKSVTQGCPMRIIDIQPFCKGQLNLLSTNSGWCWEVQLGWVHGIFFKMNNIQHFDEKGCQVLTSELTVVTRSRLFSTALEYKRSKLHMNHCEQKEAPRLLVVQ